MKINMKRFLFLAVFGAFASVAQAQDIQNPCPFGTAAGTCAQGGVITAGGPTGAATTVPVITYNAAGQLTAVTTAATGVTTNGTAAVGQLPGTATNDNAAAGKVGEYVESVINTGSQVSVSNGSAINLTTISLTAGDWDVSGQIVTNPNAATVTTALVGGLNTTTDNTLPSLELRQYNTPTSTAGNNSSVAIPRTRLSITATTTVRIVGLVNFSVNSCAIVGFLNARRVR